MKPLILSLALLAGVWPVSVKAQTTQHPYTNCENVAGGGKLCTIFDCDGHFCDAFRWPEYTEGKPAAQQEYLSNPSFEGIHISNPPAYAWCIGTAKDVLGLKYYVFGGKISLGQPYEEFLRCDVLSTGLFANCAPQSGLSWSEVIQEYNDAQVAWMFTELKKNGQIAADQEKLLEDYRQDIKKLRAQVAALKAQKGGK